MKNGCHCLHLLFITRHIVTDSKICNRNIIKLGEAIYITPIYIKPTQYKNINLYNKHCTKCAVV